MARLSFLADEHVPHAVINALRSNGYTVRETVQGPGDGTDERGERR